MKKTKLALLAAGIAAATAIPFSTSLSEASQTNEEIIRVDGEMLQKMAKEEQTAQAMRQCMEELGIKTTKPLTKEEHIAIAMCVKTKKEQKEEGDKPLKEGDAITFEPTTEEEITILGNGNSEISQIGVTASSMAVEDMTEDDMIDYIRQTANETDYDGGFMDNVHKKLNMKSILENPQDKLKAVDVHNGIMFGSDGEHIYEGNDGEYWTGNTEAEITEDLPGYDERDYRKQEIRGNFHEEKSGNILLTQTETEVAEDYRMLLGDLLLQDKDGKPIMVGSYCGEGELTKENVKMDYSMILRDEDGVHAFVEYKIKNDMIEVEYGISGGDDSKSVSGGYCYNKDFEPNLPLDITKIKQEMDEFKAQGNNTTTSGWNGPALTILERHTQNGGWNSPISVTRNNEQSSGWSGGVSIITKNQE